MMSMTEKNGTLLQCIGCTMSSLKDIKAHKKAQVYFFY